MTGFLPPLEKSAPLTVVVVVAAATQTAIAAAALSRLDVSARTRRLVRHQMLSTVSVESAQRGRGHRRRCRIGIRQTRSTTDLDAFAGASAPFRPGRPTTACGQKIHKQTHRICG